MATQANGLADSSNSTYAGWLLEPVCIPRVYAALDAGCGMGSITQTLRSHLEPWALVMALDADVKALRACVSIEGVDATVGDIAKQPYPNGTFDLVVAGHVLYYANSVTGWLREFRRVMASCGVLLAVTNSARSGERLLGLHVEACRRAGEFAMARRALEPTPRDRFTLENGDAQLRLVFEGVTARVRDDELVFDSVESAHAAYLGGLFARGAPPDATEADLARLSIRLAPHMRALLVSATDADGRVSIPRRSGYFVARP